MTYVLHYAPDNASLIIRMALEHLGVPYRCALVDRARNAQLRARYKAINPNGQIPALETPNGPIFETGAILLWLNDTHNGLGPRHDSPLRGDFLKWMVFVANTVHPALRMVFYPDKYIGSDAAHQDALRLGLQKALQGHFRTLEDMLHQRPAWVANQQALAFDFYVAALLRWPAIYPAQIDRSWFQLADYPNLRALCKAVEALPASACLQDTEGLGAHPFTDPQPAQPPVGSAT